jgi:hypothetical protein
MPRTEYGQHVHDWVSEQQGKHFCSCGCGQPLRITPRHYYRGIGNVVRGHAVRSVVQKWVNQEQGKHVCACGCGGVITLKIYHHSRGVPKFLVGHSTRVNSPTKGKFGPDSATYKGGRRRNNKGYVLVLRKPSERGPECKGDYIYELEHRRIMEGILGRKLRRRESVHHRNGNREDNRPRNLELWHRGQPAGQRVRDKLADAVRLIRQYRADQKVWPKRCATDLQAMTDALALKHGGANAVAA